MLSSFRNPSGDKQATAKLPLLNESASALKVASRSGFPERTQSFAKIFRWRLPAGQTRAPASVEVVGSFTHWQKVPLTRDRELDAWHVMIHQIPGNRTHHYMLLVDGKPVNDRNADGMAVPDFRGKTMRAVVEESLALVRLASPA